MRRVLAFLAILTSAGCARTAPVADDAVASSSAPIDATAASAEATGESAPVDAATTSLDKAGDAATASLDKAGDAATASLDQAGEAPAKSPATAGETVAMSLAAETDGKHQAVRIFVGPDTLIVEEIVRGEVEGKAFAYPALATLKPASGGSVAERIDTIRDDSVRDGQLDQEAPAASRPALATAPTAAPVIVDGPPNAASAAALEALYRGTLAELSAQAATRGADIVVHDALVGDLHFGDYAAMIDQGYWQASVTFDVVVGFEAWAVGTGTINSRDDEVAMNEPYAVIVRLDAGKPVELWSYGGLFMRARLARSPDGTRAAVTGGNGAVISLRPVRGDDGKDVWLLGPEPMQVTRLTRDNRGQLLAWSPRGALAVQSEDDIVVFDENGKSIGKACTGVPAGDGGEYDYSACVSAGWSQDGAYLCVEHSSGGLGSDFDIVAFPSLVKLVSFASDHGLGEWDADGFKVNVGDSVDEPEWKRYALAELEKLAKKKVKRAPK